ncbi:MAG: SDR family oxidoreductase [Gammaproteobacteria bacterium]|nr:SDR family oxidoreductase [Gammaproteobacteria bacterium]
MNEFKDKVVVVTGGNSGIGLAAAKAFKNAGAKLAIFGRNAETLEQAKTSLGGDTIAVQGDVTRLTDLDKLFKEVQARFGKIDVLVVNAGAAKIMPAEVTDEAAFDHISDINFKGAYFTVTKALPLFNDGASVVLLSSVAHKKGFAGLSVYNAAKAAVRSLVRTFAAEFAPKGIRVNCVSPGPIDTPIMSRIGLSPEDAEQAKQNFTQMVPLGRAGQPQEIAAVILFLASEGASYINGADIAADGGMIQV